MFFLTLAHAAMSGHADPRFAQLQQVLGVNNVPGTPGHNISLTIGTVDGELFSYVNGNMTLAEKQVLASASKWPAATALLLMMDAANVSVDDPISKYLSWWTTDPADPRSRATLRHFLTMTSGMIMDGNDGALELNCTLENVLACDDFQRRLAHGLTTNSTFYECAVASAGRANAECVRAMYGAAPALYAPGRYFAYATLSFQFVAAAMEVALGQPIEALLRQYFLTPLGFSGPWISQCSMPREPAEINPKVPVLGCGLVADNVEMSRFHRRMLRRDVLPHQLHEAQETVDMPFAQFSTSNAVWGPYGFGVWGMCLYGGVSSALPPPCVDAATGGALRITHPGKYGYIGAISRRNGFYFSLMPTYTCDASNAWCASGQPPGPNDAPALFYALRSYAFFASFMDDIFAGQAAPTARARSGSDGGTACGRGDDAP